MHYAFVVLFHDMPDDLDQVNIVDIRWIPNACMHADANTHNESGVIMQPMTMLNFITCHCEECGSITCLYKSSFIYYDKELLQHLYGL